MANNASPPFPPKLAKAIADVKRSLGKLGKTRKNEHGKYLFASIDDFMEFVSEPTDEAGLFFVPSEEGIPEMIDVTTSGGKPGTMWKCRHAFTIVHESGEAYGPIYKNVLVQALGAQSAGASQSYALKQLMRGLFNIATGEGDDPDKTQTVITSRGDDETDIQRRAGKIRRQILQAADLNDLGLIWSDNSITLDHIRKTSETAYEFLGKEYQTKKAQLESA